VHFLFNNRDNASKTHHSSESWNPFNLNLDSRLRRNCHGGFPTTEHENTPLCFFPLQAGVKSRAGRPTYADNGAIFWEMTAVVKYFLPPLIGSYSLGFFQTQFFLKIQFPRLLPAHRKNL